MVNNEALTRLAEHANAPSFEGDGPLTGLTHQTLAGDSRGCTDTALWLHNVTAPMAVPPHYHVTEEVVVVLEGTLRFRLGKRLDEWDGHGDPFEDAEVLDVGPEATYTVEKNRIHMYEAAQLPIKVMIFMPDCNAPTYAPDGSVFPLPWTT